MIRINFELYNPFSQRWRTVCYKAWDVAKNKVIETNVYATNVIVGVEFNINTGDHAGFDVRIGLLGYTAEFHLYDTRHLEDRD